MAEELSQKLFELSVTCGMNQRYAQYMVYCCEFRETMFAVFLAIGSLATLVTCAIGFFGGVVPARLSVLPALATSVLAVVFAANMPETAHYSAMFQAWSDVRRDVDSLHPDSITTEQIRELRLRVNVLNAREPYASGDALTPFLEAEERSRGIGVETE